MHNQNQLLRDAMQANQVPIPEIDDSKNGMNLPGAAELGGTSEGFANFTGSKQRPRRASVQVKRLQQRRKSSTSQIGDLENALQVSPTAGMGVRPGTPGSNNNHFVDITEQTLEMRQKREQQKKDLQGLKNWNSKRVSRMRSVTDVSASTSTTKIPLQDLPLDQQVEQEGKVFGSPEALKDEVRKALQKEDFSVARHYKTAGCAQKIARSQVFEISTLILIGVNCIWMSVDADLNTAALLPQAEPIFQVAENLFCVMFSLELLIRFLALKHKRKCLRDLWFVFDAFLVALMIVETWGVYVVFAINGTSVGIFQNATILRILRILRLLRTARMAKLLRTMPELMLLIKGIAVATRSVFFTLALLAIIIYVFAIIFMQLGRDITLPKPYFDRFENSMRTLLLEAVLPDLKEFMDDIFEGGLIFASVMMIFILLGSVTMMNMLVGVLVEVIKTVSEIEREQLEVSFVKKIFSDMITKMNLDADGDNRISKDEFDTLLSKPEAAKALLNIGVDVVGLVDYRDVLFGKEGDMELSFAEFMEAILELRGTNSAKVKDIVDLRKFVAQETGAIYELVAVATHQADSSTRSSSRASSVAVEAKIQDEC
ncbi:Catsper1 [Symbiodinium natans]|uniref:Catsper1 protein n=1 Tax=Symbiodinium natans TaxID=878477 RepID=A0A812IF07_9DINO|nr:Catsper1 [Symbiodinium natans]